MDSHNSPYGLAPTTSDLGHVLWQGNPLLQTTVNLADLLLAQPSHGPTQPYGVFHNVASTGYNSVGHPAVDHTSQGAPVWSSQPMGHTSGQCSAINHIPAGHFIESPTPVGEIYRGLSTCQWVSEDGSICGHAICEKTVPEHLRAVHGIQSMHRDYILDCGWRECEVYIKRQSIARHVREVHLGLKRNSHKYAFPCELYPLVL